MQSAAPPKPDPRTQPLRAGIAALEQGDRDAATRHLQVALRYDPAADETLQGLLQAAADDPSARALWSQVWCAVHADAKGKVRIDAPVKKLLAASDEVPEALARARALAVEELLDFADKREKKGKRTADEFLVAAFARRLAMELSRGMPVVLAAQAERLDPVLRVPDDLHEDTLKTLSRVLSSAISNGHATEAMRLARCLHGLTTQAAFKDLKGPRPDGMDAYADAARRGLARAREMLRAEIGEPWTVPELQALSPEEGERFTREHCSFAHPGVAVSPDGKYRIETDCGFQTLLGTAVTIEQHHRRLVNWFGRDPFVGRQGTVRVVPEAFGLESEGSPYWWAGGFQSGDITTVRFSCGNIEGLGRGLTHELTHRFDGAVYPGLPAWLLEGRAVWTGAAYGHSSDPEFIDLHAQFGTVEAAFVKGYAGLQKLRELVDGTLEDYRDNYTAGYALYLYLGTWEQDGRRIYAPRLRSFLESARVGASDPEEFFVFHFCDGKEGRPLGIEEFSQRFGEFISGFYWKDRKPWTHLYTTKLPPGPAVAWVYDEPTWTWSRQRAEPYFGQDQAREAGRLLVDLGRREDAVQALVWGLAVDGRTPDAERELRDLLQAMGRTDAAWVLEHGLRFPDETTGAEAPFARSLGATRSLLQLFETAVSTYRGQGLDFTAQALAADHARLSRWLGAASLALDPPFESTARTPRRHPFDESEHLAGLAGWFEEGLTGYEERRAEGLWYEDGERDLHVGRHQDLSGTGRFDRSSHQRDAFVRAEEWLLPGVYRLRTRIQFTTSYVNGCVLAGYTRRDRNLRFHFSAGSFLYAMGESEQEPKFESMSWSFQGLRDRDGPLAGSEPRGSFEFGREVPAFDLELLVDGPAVTAFINGERVGIYHTVDGAPIEGHFGFATSMGAIRVQQPLVQRLDRSRLGDRPEAAPTSLHLAHATGPDFHALQNRSFFGLPESPNGQLVLWIPVPFFDPGDEVIPEFLRQRAVLGAEAVHEQLQKAHAPQPFSVVIPEEAGPETIAKVEQSFAALDPAPTLLTHRFRGSVLPGTDDPPDHKERWLMFVDSRGVIRVATSFMNQVNGFDSHITHWLTVFKDHGRPDRALPELRRPVPGESPDPLR